MSAARSTTITAARARQASRQAAGTLTLPLRDGSVRFAAIGDSGTGDREQYQVAEQMWKFHQKFPYEFVIMMGDNLYGSETPRDYERKFSIPYKPLLDAGVKFYASLGNHDDRAQRFYKLFNMDGKTYYTFTKGDVRFFALESDYMDRRQLEWVENELRNSNSKWKVCFFHHPLYSSGERHGSDVALRQVLEPLFLKYGVDVVFAGHEHFYERLRPQKGIHYFTTGGAAKLRRGNIGTGPLTARGFDTDYHFMLLEIAGDEMHFQTVSRTGTTIDSGTIRQFDAGSTASVPD
jgi:predicted phosphodiesterase